MSLNPKRRLTPGALRFLRASAVGLGLLGLAACGSQEQASANEPLRQIDIPADFTFSTTRAVTVTVSAGFTAIPTGAKLVIERGDGSVVYSGALLADRPLTLPLMVATADQRLVLRMNSEYREWQAELQVDGPQVSYVFTEEN